MFLKKKQEGSETNDVLQQIKEKISDTSNNQTQGQASAKDVDGMMDGYSDEDNDLLNMLLSDDEDEDGEDDFNGLLGEKNSNKEVDDGIEAEKKDLTENIDYNQEDDTDIDDVDEEESDDELLTDEDHEDGEDVDDGEDDVSNVDDILNDLKATIDDEVEEEDGVSSNNDNQMAQLVDEDDIEFYDGERTETKKEEGVAKDNGVDDDMEYDVLTDLDDDNDDIDELNESDEVLEDAVDDENDARLQLNTRIQEHSSNVEDVVSANTNHNDTKSTNDLDNGWQKTDKEREISNIITVNDSTKKSVRKNISNLIEQVKRQVVDEKGYDLNKNSGSKTLEQIAIDLIQPVVIDYLNNNLERIVSDIVNEEIKRITDDIDR